MEIFIKLLTACSPMLVALIGLIPVIISNRKKTQKSIREANETMQKTMAGLKTDFDNHVDEYEEAKARSQRYRILRFYDEICEGRKHSESHFEDILDDIDDYEGYCETHPQFKNGRGHVAMQHIRDIYAKVKSKGGFLMHE